jgi:hypothetical protein
MVMGINNSISYLKKASIPALFKELRKREGVSCIVVDDKYVLKLIKVKLIFMIMLMKSIRKK